MEPAWHGGQTQTQQLAIKELIILIDIQSLLIIELFIKVCRNQISHVKNLKNPNHSLKHSEVIRSGAKAKRGTMCFNQLRTGYPTTNDSKPM